MDRLDRLFSLLLTLQDGRVHRGEDLAVPLGVSLRTLYRDMASLVSRGIPLRSEAGVGYQLKRGFFLSPLDFTSDEAVVLNLGLAWMEAHTAGRWARFTQTATAKVRSALGPRALAEADRLGTLVSVFSDRSRLDLDDSKIRLCLKAITEARTLRLTYTSLRERSTTERVVEPLGLSYAGRWYLSAWCRLRGEHRSFRLDRIDALHWQGEPFDPRPPAESSARQWDVVLRVPESERRWLTERRHWGWVSDVGDRSNFAISDLDEFVAWLLPWAGRVTVEAPAELRDKVRTAAESWLRQLT